MKGCLITLNIILKDKAYLDLSNIPIDYHQRINNWFEKGNPDFFRNQALGFSNWQTPKNIYIHFSRYNPNEKRFTDEVLLFPIGLLDKFVEYLKTLLKCDVKITDERLTNPLTEEIDSKIITRDYQERALKFLEQTTTNGLLVAKCGSGKTILGIEMIARLKQKTLIIVHTKALMEQWVKEIYNFLGYEAGQLGDGKKKIKDITVAIIKTAYNQLANIQDKFGFILIDECHHVAADTFYKLLNNMAAKYKIGLTATPSRKDQKTFLFKATLGDVIHKVTKKELIDAGIIMQASGIVVKTDFVCPEYLDDPDQYPKDDPKSRNPNFKNMTYLKSKLISDTNRIKLIFSYLEPEMKKGHKCLMLFDRFNLNDDKMEFDTINKWVSWINAKGYKAKAFTGKIKHDLEELKKEFEAGNLNILVASTTFDEGVNIPCLDRIFICLPCHKNDGLLEQRIGRIERVHKGKTDAIFYYFLDQYVFGTNLDFLNSYVIQSVKSGEFKSIGFKF